MSDVARERLERERKRLILAESDMRQAEAAAEYLHALGEKMNGDTQRALWTGLVVTYARPFSASKQTRCSLWKGRSTRGQVAT